MSKFIEVLDQEQGDRLWRNLKKKMRETREEGVQGKAKLGNQGRAKKISEDSVHLT